MNGEKKQTIAARLLWFAVGGGLSTGINAGIFTFAKSICHWPDWQGYALSLSVVTVVNSFWNYFVNFRTSAAWRECLPRYLGVVALGTAINYGVTLAGFRQLDASAWMKVAIIALVQGGTSVLKFGLYHYWVYPHGGKAAEA